MANPAEVRQAISELSEDAQRDVARCVLSLRIPYRMTPGGMQVDLDDVDAALLADLVSLVPPLRERMEASSPDTSHAKPNSARQSSARGAFNATVKRLARSAGFSSS